MKRLLCLVVVVAGCWTSSQKSAPAPIANEAKQASPPAKPGESKQVQRTASGGVLELVGDRGAALMDATEQMSRHCGSNNYSITQEGEEAIGSDAARGQPVRVETAWRVHYVCNNAP